MTKYEIYTVKEREKIKLRFYQKFKDKFLKKCKNFSPQELEHERIKYVGQNFHEELYKNKK